MTPRPRHAFTLIELITVIIILALLAGVVAPRLRSTNSRRAESSVEEVANLLSIAAKRDLLGSRRMALEFDAQTGVLSLFTLRVGDTSSFETGAEQWLVDPLAPPVTLDAVELVGASADGAILDERRFRVELRPTTGRPGLALLLADSTTTWLVRLAPTSDRAVITAGEAAAGQLTLADPDSIDLDRAGRRDDPW